MWLIATAKTHGYTVVTMERFVGDQTTKKVKIPNISRYYEVDCINLFELLNRLNYKLIRAEI